MNDKISLGIAVNTRFASDERIANYFNSNGNFSTTKTIVRSRNLGLTTFLRYDFLSSQRFGLMIEPALGYTNSYSSQEILEPHNESVSKYHLFGASARGRFLMRVKGGWHFTTTFGNIGYSYSKNYDLEIDATKVHTNNFDASLNLSSFIFGLEYWW